MLTRELQDALRPAMRVQSVIWLALVGAVGLYVAIAYFASPAPDEAEGVEDFFIIVMSVMAVASAVASFVAPKLLLSDRDVRQHMTEDEVRLKSLATHESGHVDEAKLAVLQKLSDRDQRIMTLSLRSFVPWVIGIALAESIAIYGLVLAFLSATPDLIVPFAAASVLILFFHRPSMQALARRADAQRG